MLSNLNIHSVDGTIVFKLQEKQNTILYPGIDVDIARIVFQEDTSFILTVISSAITGNVPPVPSDANTTFITFPVSGQTKTI